MRLPQYVKEESIGNPDLFCGREEELNNFLRWIELIPQKGAKSRALMATKKMGKTAILDRLYNILFQKAVERTPNQPLVIQRFRKKLPVRNHGLHRMD